MSTLGKFVLGVVIVLGIGSAVWGGGFMKPKQSVPVIDVALVDVATTTAVVPQNTNGMSPANDLSDVALEQDITAIDVQVAGMVTDGTHIIQSLQDKQVVQAY